MRTKHDAHRGIYEKFTIKRTDGRHRKGEKHHGCRYFVLDLTHDEHAAVALLAYASSCADDFPVLAVDLYVEVARIEKLKEERAAIEAEHDTLAKEIEDG